MTNEDYKQKKQECLDKFCKEYGLFETADVKDIFGYAFDRAYALGKQKEIILHEYIQRAAEKYADTHFPVLLVNISKKPWPYVKAYLEHAYKAGAHFALANQWISVDDQLPETDSDVLVFPDLGKEVVL